MSPGDASLLLDAAALAKARSETQITYLLTQIANCEGKQDAALRVYRLPRTYWASRPVDFVDISSRAKETSLLISCNLCGFTAFYPIDNRTPAALNVSL